MATPKKKISRSRRNMRRFSGGNALDKPTSRACPSCGEPARPHTVCKCGFYKERQVLPAKSTPAVQA